MVSKLERDPYIITTYVYELRNLGLVWKDTAET